MQNENFPALGNRKSRPSGRILMKCLQVTVQKFYGLYKRFMFIKLGIQPYDTFSETLFFSENICGLHLQLPVLFNLNHLFEINQKTYLALKNNQCSSFNRFLTNSLSPITVQDFGNVTAGLIENKQNRSFASRQIKWPPSPSSLFSC